MGPETPGLAETPHPGGVFVDEDPQAGDSGHPPVILRRGVQYRTIQLAKSRKNQGPKTPAWEAGNSGQEKSCSKETLPFLPFLVKDA